MGRSGMHIATRIDPMSILGSQRVLRVVALLICAACVVFEAGCGSSGSSSTAIGGGALSGNWQFNLTQNYPGATQQFSVSGFVVDSNGTLTGTVQGPTVISTNFKYECGGVGPFTGAVSGQNVTFTVNPGGTVFNFAGTLSSDNASMTGTYQSLAGACSKDDTTGTFTALLVPPITGNFSGTLTDSTYMSELTGVSPATPIAVTGTLTQSATAGGSSASVTGTITAASYPCFQTVSLTGTISGQNVYLDVYDYTGVEIGTIGTLGVATGVSFPATVVSGSSGVELTGTNVDFSGLNLTTGNGPCPAIGIDNTKSDTTGIDFVIQ